MPLLAIVLATAGQVSSAPPQKFPYEAVVRQDDVSVRSGPGRAFYPTSKLKVGDRVSVVRHNHGGWYMIQPPPGSFSWVPARTVERGEGNRGTITVNNTPARVGSDESDLRDVVQRNLAKGEVVEILGEKVLTNPDGRKEQWLRIAPPKYEWRYVLGQFVTTDFESVGPGVDVASTATPAAAPTILPADGAAPSQSELAGPRLAAPTIDEARRVLDEIAVGDVELASPPADTPMPERLVESPSNGKPPSTLEGRLTPEVARAEARRLDARLQKLLEGPPETWQFDELRSEYDKLLSEADDGEVDALIQQRLQLIARHEATGQKAARIADIRRETERRDQELAEKLKSIGTKPAPDVKAASVSKTAAPDRQIKPAAFDGDISAAASGSDTPPRRLPVPGLEIDPEVSTTIPPIPGDDGSPAAPELTQPVETPKPAATATPRFVGAGIVQKAPQKRHAFAPPYHLVAPNGRHLAWLIADQGFDLAAWVGKPVGLSGERSKFPQLQSDIIRVTGASPVRLAP